MKTIVSMPLEEYEQIKVKLEKIARNKGWREGYTFAVDIIRDRILDRGKKSIAGDREFIKHIEELILDIKRKYAPKLGPTDSGGEK